MDDKDLKAQIDDLLADIGPESGEGVSRRSDAALDKLIAELLEAAPRPTAGAPVSPAAPQPTITEAGEFEVEAETLIAELVAPPVEVPAVPPAAVVVPAAPAEKPGVTVPPPPTVAEAVAPPTAPAPPVGPAAEHVTARPAEPFPWEVQLQAHRTRILNILLSVAAGIATVIIVTLVVFGLRQPDLWRRYIPYFIAWAVLVALALARRLDPRWRTGVLVSLAYLAGILALWIDGPLGAGGWYLLLAPLLFSILVRPRAGVYAAVASFAIYVAMSAAHGLGWLQAAGVLDPRQWDTVVNLSSTFGMLLVAATLIQWLFSSTVLAALREAQTEYMAALEAQTLLQKQADELAAANVLLKRRTTQLQTASLVSGTAALSALDLNELMQQVVNSIREQLDLQYAGLFLTDGSGEWAALQAAAGEAGRQMLAHGYRLVVNTYSPVGWCIVNARPHIPIDVKAIALTDPVNQTTIELLPDTRSEIVLPLRSRGKMLGALDLRSTRPAAFSEDDIPVLQMMADQVAVGIDNAQLFASMQESLRAMEEVQRRYVREQWARFAPARMAPAYERARPDVGPLGDLVLPEVEQAITQRTLVMQSGAERAALVAPIMLRGEVIGVLGLHDTHDQREWTADEIALVQAIADQMSLAIENARLLEETQQRAERERLVTDITTRVRAYMDLESIMQAAVRELGAVLGADRAFIRLGSGSVRQSIAQAERAYGDRDNG